MGVKQVYDAGYCLGNGEQWQAIPGGPISVPSVNNVSEIRLIGNDNVEIVAPAPPAYGTWKVGDRVENSALGQASDPKDKHNVASWRCATAGTPGTWLPQRLLAASPRARHPSGWGTSLAVLRNAADLRSGHIRSGLPPPARRCQFCPATALQTGA